MFDQARVPDRSDVIGDRYRPPRPVWVDLGMVFPLHERPRRIYPEALDLQAEVPGELHMHALTTTGMHVAYVTFPVTWAHGRFDVTQWIVARAVQPRVDTRDRRTRDPRSAARHPRERPPKSP